MEYLTIKYQTTKNDLFMFKLDNMPYRNFILVESIILVFIFLYVLLTTNSSLLDKLSTSVGWILFFLWIILIIIFFIVAYYGVIIKPDILPSDYKIDTEITIHKRFFISDPNGFFSPMRKSWANVKSIKFDEKEIKTSIWMDYGGGFEFKNKEWTHNEKYVDFHKLFTNFYQDWKKMYGINKTMPKDLQSFLNELQETNPEVKTDIIERYLTYTCDIDGNVLTLQMPSHNINSVPESICKLNSLHILELQDNMITSIPDCLKQLDSVKLILTGNPLT